MNDLVKAAIGVLVVSIIAVAWGYNYTSTHQLSGLANMFGSVDPTYTMANWAIGIGALGVLLGAALLIGGLVKKNEERNYNSISLRTRRHKGKKRGGCCRRRDFQDRHGLRRNTPSSTRLARSGVEIRKDGYTAADAWFDIPWRQHIQDIE
jgi:hypothetical protein